MYFDKITATDEKKDAYFLAQALFERSFLKFMFDKSFCCPYYKIDEHKNDKGNEKFIKIPKKGFKTEVDKLICCFVEKHNKTSLKKSKLYRTIYKIILPP